MLRVLAVVNKMLPGGDYRVAFAQASDRVRIDFAMPGIHAGIDPERILPYHFGEGFGWRDLRELLRLREHLVENAEGYGLVHFYCTGLTLFGPLAARSAGLPSVVTITGFGRIVSGRSWRTRMLRPLYWWLLARALRTVRAALLQNHADLQSLRERFPEHRDKLHYVGSAVAPPSSEGDDRAKGETVILTVTRLLPDKGVERLLKTARALKTPSVRFVLVGPHSPGAEHLLQAVQGAVDEGRLEYRGELSPEDTQREMSRAQVFYFPSSYGEGLPRVLLEAGLQGLVPVACDIPANRDLIADGRGLLLPVDEPASDADRLRALLEDPDRMRSEAEAYRAHIREHYDPVVFTRRLEGLYAAAIEPEGER